MNQTNRRHFLRTATAGVMAAGLNPNFSIAQEAGRKKPNIVILFIDDLGYGDIACFGNPRIPTPPSTRSPLVGPNAQCPTSPIRPAAQAVDLMTGMYAQRLWQIGHGSQTAIPEDHPTMGEFMRDAGYTTGQIGKWDIGDNRQGPSARIYESLETPLAINTIAKMKMGAMLPDRSRRRLHGRIRQPKRHPYDKLWAAQALLLMLLSLRRSLERKNTPQHYRDRIPGGDGTAYEGAVVAVDAPGQTAGPAQETRPRKRHPHFLHRRQWANRSHGGSSDVPGKAETLNRRAGFTRPPSSLGPESFRQASLTKARPPPSISTPL